MNQVCLVNMRHLFKIDFTENGTTGPRSQYHPLFQDPKNIFQMDAFTNDGGNTTCIIGFNQKFDQATASSEQWCKKFSKDYNTQPNPMPSDGVKLPILGGFVCDTSNTPLDTPNTI